MPKPIKNKGSRKAMMEFARVTRETSDQLDELAELTNRPKSAVIRGFIESQLPAALAAAKKGVSNDSA